MGEKKRCSWAEVDDLMRAYHDTEWGVPQRNDRIIFEYILLDSFQAGLSWATILRKRENFRNVFDGFDPRIIAQYDTWKITRLMSDTGIVRNRGKIEAAISNATVFLNVQKECGSFAKYLWAWVDNTPLQSKWKTWEDVPAKTELSDRISSNLKKRRFRFFGSTICYAFMQGSGLVNDHVVDCFRHEEVAFLAVREDSARQ